MAGFSSNDGCGDALIAELFGIYNGLVLLINNSVLHVECETDSTEIINLLMDRQSHSFHAYAYLLAQVQLIYLTSLIFNSSSTHLVHEPSSTNQLSNRVSNYFRVGSVHCQT